MHQQQLTARQKKRRRQKENKRRKKVSESNGTTKDEMKQALRSALQAKVSKRTGVAIKQAKDSMKKMGIKPNASSLEQVMKNMNIKTPEDLVNLLALMKSSHEPGNEDEDITPPKFI